MFEIMEKDSQEAVIKVIGVGGCGGNAIAHMIEKAIGGVEFICANTDMQALNKSQAKVILTATRQLATSLVESAKAAERIKEMVRSREKLIDSYTPAF